MPETSESRVFLSAFAGSLHGYVQRGDETVRHHARRGWDRETPEHSVRRLTREEWAALAASWRCDAELRPPAPSREAMLTTAIADTGQPFRATIAVDTDYELFHLFSNATAERNYISNELAAVSAIYWRDLKTRLQVGFLRVWTSTADPWAATTPLASLFEVGDYWHAHGAGVSRSSVVFLSGKPTGRHRGSGPCAKAILGRIRRALGAPTPSSNIEGLTIFNPLAGRDVGTSGDRPGGHTFDRCTHCYSPPIDECYGKELGCYSGPAVDPGAGVGTIMSYCHLFGWSEIREVPQPVHAELRPTIVNAALSPRADGNLFGTCLGRLAASEIYTIAAWGITTGCALDCSAPSTT